MSAFVALSPLPLASLSLAQPVSFLLELVVLSCAKYDLKSGTLFESRKTNHLLPLVAERFLFQVAGLRKITNPRSFR